MAFSFEDILNGLQAAVEQKKAATTQFTETQTRETARVAKSAEQLNAEAMTALGEVNTLDQQRAKAQGLADSGNFLDRLELMGQQIINPQAYTRQGRTARAGEISNDLAMRSQIHGITATSAAANITAAEAVMKGAQAKQGMLLEGIRANTEAMQAQFENLQAAELLKQAQLPSQTVDQLRSALGQAKNGVVSVNGMNYTPTEIRERIKALETREQLSFLAPAITDPDYAAKLAVYHQSQLQLMNGAELRAIRDNGGIMADGTQVRPDVLDQALTRWSQKEADDFQRLNDDFLVNNIMGEEVSNAGKLIQRIAPQVGENSPLSTQFTTFQAETANLAKAAQNPDLTDNQRRMAMERYAGARKAFFDQADKEATRRAGTDKDLKDIYYNQIIGGHVEPVQVQEVVVGRLTSNKPLAKILPGPQASRLKKLYDKHYNEVLMRESQQALQGGADKRPDSVLKQEAAQLALQQIASETIGDKLTSLQVNSPNLDGHPLKNVMIPGQVQEVIVTSSNKAWDKVKAAYGLTTEQVEAMKRGQPVSGVNVNQVLEDQKTASFQEEYMAYESIQPGLGVAVADWYTMNGDAVIRKQFAETDPMIGSLTVDYLDGAIFDLTAGWQNAKESMSIVGAQKVAEMMSGANDPFFSNALILQSDSNLTEPQRKLIFDNFVKPALSLAQQQGLDQKQTMELIERAIQEAKPTSPDIKTALQLHRQSRLTIQSNFKLFQEELLLNSGVKSLAPKVNQSGTGFFQQTMPTESSNTDTIMKNRLQNSTLKWAYPQGNQ